MFESVKKIAQHVSKNHLIAIIQVSESGNEKDSEGCNRKQGKNVTGCIIM
jgi:hypothetical protein